jgi:hypothetical protein
MFVILTPRATQAEEGISDSFAAAKPVPVLKPNGEKHQFVD